MTVHRIRTGGGSRSLAPPTRLFGKDYVWDTDEQGRLNLNRLPPLPTGTHLTLTQGYTQQGWGVVIDTDWGQEFYNTLAEANARIRELHGL